MSADITVLFDKNISLLAASLDDALQSTLEQYEQLRKAGQKGELSHVYISFLPSSVLCKLPWLRIDLYDGNISDDMVECYSDWDVANISDNSYRSIESRAKQNRMKDYEIEQTWLDSTDEYFKAFEDFLPKIIEQSKSAKAINCEWHFGQYLGSTVAVWERNVNEIF